MPRYSKEDAPLEAAGEEDEDLGAFVNIDIQKIKVNYETKEEYIGLLKEWSTGAYTNKYRLNTPKGKFFKYVYYGEDTFTGKMCFNKHR